jgi:hypothetical protein
MGLATVIDRTTEACPLCRRRSGLSAADGGLCLSCTARLSPGLRRVAALVLGLSYRPGWRFRLRQGPPLAVEVSWLVPDVHGGADVLLSACVEVVDLSRDPDDVVRHFLRGLWAVIEQLEGHERMELVRVHGRPLWNAHPEGAGELASVPTFREPLP